MIQFDEKKVLRFTCNRIVRDVYDEHIDLNEIENRYQKGLYTIQEKFQFLALLGYSVDGWNGLLHQDFNVNKCDAENI